MQQISPNFQDSDDPLLGAWQDRYARVSAAQVLPHNSASTHLYNTASMQVDIGLKKEQIDTLIVRVGGH
eukprot:scaffold5630_cov17-Tisochrysis_lutea.AAC.1